MQRLPDHAEQWPGWAHVLHGIIRGYGQHWHRARWDCSTVPAEGPAILVCNHVSVLDPLLLIASNFRIISFIIAREYYEQPVLRPFLDAVGCIPARRDGSDRKVIVRARQVLKEGRVLGIFPEGGIGRGPEAMQEGVAWLVQQTGAPVVPARVTNAAQRSSDIRTFLSRQKPCLRYGAPLELDADLPREEILQRIIASIESLADARRLGCYD